MARRLLWMLSMEEREMGNRNLLDSELNLVPVALPKPLDTGTGPGDEGCPPDWPLCGTDPGISRPTPAVSEPALSEPASPAAR